MVNKRRVILVDDEPLARVGLKNSLKCRHPDFDVVAEAESAAEAWELVEQDGKIDGVFLDIHIQSESERAGLDLAFALNHLVDPPWIIFVTGYAEHALEAHEIHAVGYLVKPLEEAKVDSLLDWIRKNRPVSRQGRISIRHRIKNGLAEYEWRTEFVDLNEILYIHKNKSVNTVRVHLAQGIVLDGINATLATWETQLCQHGFLKIGKSSIVNLKLVRSLISPPAGSEVYKLSFKCGIDELSVGLDYLDKLHKAMKS
ncbi:MAG: response regulator transcription factor [Methyloglobulus sp.]|nr:response regulator transcription factor [Methyloglobulus sp.]